jgi:hypothetical protein
VHLLSNGVRLIHSRFVTVERVDLKNPQYRGEGGNGYMFVLQGNDCLIADSKAEKARHGFSLSWMTASGNVLLRFTTKGARLPSDFHQKMSAANLVDNATVDGDGLEAAYRDCCDHGHSTTESVFWNTQGLAYHSRQIFVKFIIESLQFGTGYVIGTRGPASQVLTTSLSSNGTSPVDFTEGIGTGDELRPLSLYEDQRARRLGLPFDDGSPDAGTSSSSGGASSSGEGPPGESGGGGSGGDGAAREERGNDGQGGGCALGGSTGGARAWCLSALALALLALSTRLRRRR